MTEATNTERSIVLVPGYWLGGWAWDAVIDQLRRGGHPAFAITLPGLDDRSTPRASIHFSDHVDAVADAVRDVSEPVVLVAHSGAGAVVTAVLDAIPDRVVRMIYVDSGPTANGAVPRPDVAADSVELALPSFEELKSTGVSLAGLDDDALQRFRDRSVPHSAGAVREPLALKNPDRNAVPATIVRCSFPSHAVRDLAGSGNPMFVALTELQDLTYVDPPTGHWPMWSRPDDLAEIIAAESERD
jgi:pimeloyl-ACP methyl ester carboxylesterase